VKRELGTILPLPLYPPDKKKQIIQALYYILDLKLDRINLNHGE